MKKRFSKASLLLLVGLFLVGCGPAAEPLPLPILGNKVIDGTDTTYHTIPPFSFVNQNNLEIDNQSLLGKIHVADFFFTSCPTICPKLTQQMLRIQEAFETEDNLLLVSFTVDPETDSVERLKSYSSKIEAEDKMWHFLTGDRDALHDLADDYFSTATTNPDAPGGYDHSGRLILVDKAHRVRSFCDGTDPEKVDIFMDDIRNLLSE